MDYILNTVEMQEADKFTIASGTKSLDLMEKAGSKVADLLMSKFDIKKSFLILCGPGGNGGDGYVVARKLFNKKYKVCVLSIATDCSKDCAINKEKYKGKIINGLDGKKYDVIVDALFGIGLEREVKGEYFTIINEVNLNTKSFIVSIDINSGINSNNGLVMGAAIKSNLTIAIQEYKVGHYLNDAKSYIGSLTKVDIGIKAKEYVGFARLFNIKDCKFAFPKRLSRSNKGNYGKSVIIGGSKEYLGAPLLSLASLAALRAGVGYSGLGFPASLSSLYALKNLETINYMFKDRDGEILFDKDQLDELLSYDSICIGMGIGISRDVYKIIRYLLENFENNLIIDADGLNSLAQYGVDILKNKKCNVTITPHIKEFSRLSKLTVKEIEADPIGCGKKFARKYSLNLVLKSNTTVITDGNTIYVVANGSPCLAKGGSGDMLTGIIGALLTKRIDTLKRAACGCFVLAEASVIATKKINENSVIASDIIKLIPRVIDEIQK